MKMLGSAATRVQLLARNYCDTQTQSYTFTNLFHEDLKVRRGSIDTTWVEDVKARFIVWKVAIEHDTQP